MTGGPVPIERVARKVCALRGAQVVFGFNLAELYEVTTRALNQAVVKLRELEDLARRVEDKV